MFFVLHTNGTRKPFYLIFLVLASNEQLLANELPIYKYYHCLFIITSMFKCLKFEFDYISVKTVFYRYFIYLWNFNFFWNTIYKITHGILLWAYKESIGIVEVFDLRFSKKIQVPVCPEYDLTIFEKCLSISVWHKFCSFFNSRNDAWNLSKLHI